MAAPLHSQGVTILFGGVLLGLFSQGFGLTSKASVRTINSIDGAVENDLYVPKVRATVKERSATLEGLCASMPPASLLGAMDTLSFAGAGWTDNVGQCVLESFQVTGRVGEYLKISFTFRRAE